MFSFFKKKKIVSHIRLTGVIGNVGKFKQGIEYSGQEDIERLKSIQLELHQEFINVVEESRNKKLKKDMGVELFSGEFWSGKKSKELGLIDGLGNAEQILREKFGEDVEVKVFEKSKGWLAKRISSENQIDKIANIIEERSIWQRYGL